MTSADDTVERCNLCSDEHGPGLIAGVSGMETKFDLVEELAERLGL